MPVLALDTSAAVAVALTDDTGALLAERSDAQQRRHAELLTPMVAAVLAEAGVDRRELTSVVVGTGPAPFTGLRVGLVTARTLALALAVPVLGVPSLDAVAARAGRVLQTGTDVLVATDARRREVYWSLYRTSEHGIEVLAGPEVAAAAEVAADPRAAGAVATGRGALLYADVLRGGTGSADVDLEALGLLDPDPAELARLALTRRAAGQALGTEPLYLRRPDAVPQPARKRVLG
ncbi:tRNA (adenosine(37)-N6)-threonylcarbamoyltransferase complex dimerization subunit type 1 TsaB [Cellulomonas fengjieae]|uniref:tRNA (Adenosine(37)-N6)-threonylcarbamoyltransferase complex dimerization subunit type 1 TsaB n=1 Tax=Cellulomonas fengjieae TaxID=2819978 RepID=A0ABS3SCZ6_9CELL|nr:tRNA (adenosine(37)-N6)-threonylcarbamoyltransferase complex dimerization subunit type 1 TsaB [Cellulomonas fengjieae]MBO3083602.1 tRNA (adenosine(37)-N6)-threonylcarbamoyltransferase complex dimerization subunit type 1 TsaB [Cellulomonas fengjieae]QVI65081.1 tRNA (adenosine(37)-N6)-threonylcarbamoyltransferase complex dimerization subunit type 1 TsaB [Cellulomonas fengjieae]